MEKFNIRKATLEDAQILADFGINLAKETEDLVLDPQTVLAGVKSLI